MGLIVPTVRRLLIWHLKLTSSSTGAIVLIHDNKIAAAEVSVQR
jgi:hypothetical protein